MYSFLIVIYQIYIQQGDFIHKLSLKRGFKLCQSVVETCCNPTIDKQHNITTELWWSLVGNRINCNIQAYTQHLHHWMCISHYQGREWTQSLTTINYAVEIPTFMSGPAQCKPAVDNSPPPTDLESIVARALQSLIGWQSTVQTSPRPMGWSTLGSQRLLEPGKLPQWHLSRCFAQRHIQGKSWYRSRQFLSSG